MTDPDLSRYAKQTLFRPIGMDGQRRLRTARVLVCGCGALGSALAEGLTRAGIGFLRIVDRDFVDLSNLQRQVLFTEEDVASGVPKAIAAKERLQQINSTVDIEAQVTDIGPDNILSLASDVDLILDGLDNFETRFLINDAALEINRPWIYAGAIGSHGQTMTILPHQTACLRCLIDQPPAPGTAETCDTAGVLQPIISSLTALQIVSAIKLLIGRADLIEPMLTMLDVWENTHRKLSLQSLRDQGHCPACHRGERLWLRGERTAQTSVLCGRNAVQVTPAERQNLSLERLKEQWQPLGTVMKNPFLLRLKPQDSELELTLFADGRAIIKGTEDLTVARSLYTRYVGL